MRLVNGRGQFVAIAYGNPHSLIAARVLSRNEAEAINKDWLVEKLIKAARLRHKMGFAPFSHRLCFGEADGIPGLVVDRFLCEEGTTQVFVAQVLTAGTEVLCNGLWEVIQAFAQRAAANHIYSPSIKDTVLLVRRDVKARALEQLEIQDAEVFGTQGKTILENARILVRSANSQSEEPVLFSVDLLGGQKTGFFLDQGGNIEFLLHQLPWPNAGETLKVLDLFCYVGQWGTQLARAAKKRGVKLMVTAVDASEKALAIAKRNIEGEGAKAETICMDIVAESHTLPAKEYDVVVCDPPALIKSKKDHPQGKKAYQKVNSNALRALKSGGFYISCSCSQHLSEEDLVDVLVNAQQRSARSLQWVGRGYQASDHPLLFEFPQGKYLKAWFGFDRD